MFGKKGRKAPEQVFTPRSAHVNELMYVNRGYIEERLVDALKGNKYIVVHGESGNGKTWLYKKVFADLGLEYTVVNLANAKLYGSLSAALEDKLEHLQYKEDGAVETTTTGGFRPQNIGMERASKIVEVRQTRGAFSKLVSWLRRSAGDKRCAIVFDNFEQIIDDDEILEQLRAIIISADDEEIAASKIKILLVGVPGNLKEMIAKSEGAGPIVTG
jgi:hypothetical protein